MRAKTNSQHPSQLSFFTLRSDRPLIRTKAVTPLTISLLLFFLGQGCATLSGTPHEGPQRESIAWVDGKSQVHRWTLSNGLRLVVLEDHTSPTFAWQTWFGVGSRDEETGKTGLAHLFEHMMFKGTRYRSDGEFDRILDAAGAEGQNAFTSNDHTAYVQELPIESLELIATLESERMRGLIVNEEAFSTEREVVQNERRMRTENSPDGVMYQELFGLAFEKQNYHWPVIGYAKDLENMSAEDARRFYDRWYQPSNATVVVVGDVKPEEVLRLVQKKYAFPQPPASNGVKVPHLRSYPTEPPQNRVRTKTLPLNIQADKILVGWKIPRAGHSDLPALLVLDALATSGLSARLKERLVESGMASSIFGYPMIGVDPSLYIVGASLQPGQKATAALENINSTYREFAKTPISLAELEKAKTRLEYDFFSGLDSNAEIANFLGENETDLGSFQEALAVRNAIKKITPKEVQNFARSWLGPQTQTVIIGTPKVKASRK